MQKRSKIPALIACTFAFSVFAVAAVFFLHKYGLRPANAQKEKEVKEKTNAEIYKETQKRFYVADVDLKFVEATSSATLELHGKNALTVDLNTNQILLSKAAKEKAPIASLTKIMTAVVALEHKELSDKFVVSEKAATTGENSMGITAGETYTLEDLLYGLILNSGNDAAVGVAEGVAGSEEKFVEWMNIKAGELGLIDTKFFDASGLNDNNESTAYDLAKLTRYALKNPDFKKIVGTLEWEIPYEASADENQSGTSGHKYIYLSNQTNLLKTYPGVHGVKTGYTEVANLCLVTYAQNSDHEIIGVVLGSDNRKYDMVRMLDFSFEMVGVKVEHPLITF